MRGSEFQKTILSQYSNSKTLLALLSMYNVRVDPHKDVVTFFQEVFNLDTCGTYGLDVWGTIVAAPRLIEVESEDYFGFDGTEYTPFNDAPFWTGNRATNVYRLENEAYRALIYFKAMINIMSTNLPGIDKAIAQFLSARGIAGNAYSQDHTSPYFDGGVMTMDIVFEFVLDPIDRAIFRTYGKDMRPGGVLLNFVEIPDDTFGFLGSELQPFNQGIFYIGSYGSF